MLGSDVKSSTGDTTASICGVASCLVLDILQQLVKVETMRQYMGTETQVIPMLIGALHMLAEKNEHLEHQVRFDPREELGSINYFTLPEIDNSPKCQYPKFKYYRPSYTVLGAEEDKHNESVSEEWSSLRCHRSQPLVLERCAVLLWTFAKVILASPNTHSFTQTLSTTSPLTYTITHSLSLSLFLLSI